MHLFLMLLAGGLWIFSLRHLWREANGFLADALPYYEHVKFFLDNIRQGIYPFWDPFRDFGTLNEFYLRRIGEFNPLFWLIVLFDKAGLSFLSAYKLFFILYFLLGVAAFYLLARRLFGDRRPALLAALLLLFSSLGWHIACSYLLFIIVPSICFMYFLVAFVQSAQCGDHRGARAFLLGSVFCLMLLMITYIPFYFLTVALVGALAFAVVYAPIVKSLGRSVWQFVRANKVFSGFCAVCLLVGLLPGFLWYLESAQGEALMSHRHAGFRVANMPTIDLELANQGGIVTPLAIDQNFFDLDQRRLGDFYVPLFAFLVIAAGALTAFTRRMVFLLAWGLAVYLIGVADASYFHKFFYDHVFFFKYFRNLQFFMWLAVLPIFLMLTAQIFSQTLAAFEKAKDRRGWTVYVLAVHAAAFLAFWFQDGNSISGNYAAIALSALFFLSALYRQSWASAVVLFAAVVIQPLQVNAFVNRFFHDIPDFSHYRGDYAQLNLPVTGEPNALRQSPFRKYDLTPYFCPKSFYVVCAHIKTEILSVYLVPRLLAYDRVAVFDEQKPDFRRVEKAFAHFENTAFVPSQDPSLAGLFSNRPSSPQAGIITQDSKQVQLLRFDPNRLVLKTRFDRDKFLVYNQNHHARWQAFCDGRPTKLFRANLSFQGVFVPAGEHIIELRFGRPWQYAAAFFLLAFYFTAFIYVIWLLFKKKNS